MENIREMLCERCKKFYPNEEIRYMPKTGGRIALCSGCREDADVKSAKPTKAHSEGKKDYFCGRCRYHFKHSSESLTTLRCPYCSKDDKILEDVKGTTEQLIREADFEKY